MLLGHPQIWQVVEGVPEEVVEEGVALQLQSWGVVLVESVELLQRPSVPQRVPCPLGSMECLEERSPLRIRPNP